MPRHRWRPTLNALVVPAALFVLAAADLPDQVPVPVPDPRSQAPAPAPATGAETPPPTDQNPPPEKPDEAALAACEAGLKALGAMFERRDAIDGPGTCGLPATYDLSEIIGGVAIGPETQMRCETALATARWTANVVAPAAKVFGDDVRLTGIRHASTYVCRNRNGQPDTKISEHAVGDAIDVATFEFSGHDDLSIRPDQPKGSLDEVFQKAIQAGACLHFTTVLGPGSDGFHDTHVHLDLARRRGGYRLCQ
ncbi:MAG: extensin family protein [Oricola sp.]